jgi:hypothetical protein
LRLYEREREPATVLARQHELADDRQGLSESLITQRTRPIASRESARSGHTPRAMAAATDGQTGA